MVQMNTFTVHCFQHEEEATYLDLSGNSIGETESRFVLDLLFRNPIFTELVCQTCFYHILTKTICNLHKVSMIRIYHNHKLQTNPWYREEEPHNNQETPGRQTKQSNQLSHPHRDDCKARMDTK